MLQYCRTKYPYACANGTSWLFLNVNPVKFSRRGTRTTRATAGHSPPDRLVEAAELHRVSRQGYTLRYTTRRTVCLCLTQDTDESLRSSTPSLPAHFNVILHLGGSAMG